MKIVIFGAGYVGTVTGACLASMGHQVVLIDPNEIKTQAINAGKSPILEPSLETLIQKGRENNLLAAYNQATKDLLDCDIAMIAVATPSHFNGSLNLNQVINVFQTIHSALLIREKKLTIVVRSTIHSIALNQALLKSQISTIKDKFSLVINPEFLRESTAIYDFFNPPFCVAGGENKQAVEQVLSIYSQVSDKLYAVSLETACLLKYACNAFHALKIAFTNEVSSVCETMNVDPTELMQVFSQDKLLNCSSAYLKPGFSFGGSCLPKDLRAFLSLSREIEEEIPLIASILPSNQHRFNSVLSKILMEDYKEVAVIGMSFKKNNDDLRESPFVQLIETLIGKGINVRIYDSDVCLSKLTGSNLKSLMMGYDHLISRMHSNLASALLNCEAVIICKDLQREELIDFINTKKIPFYDLQYSIPELSLNAAFECSHV